MTELKYSNYEDRSPQGQYKNIIRTVLDNGIWTPSPMVDENTGELLQTCDYMYGISTTFDILKNGAPIITERNVGAFYDKAVNELFAFIKGAHTSEQLKEAGCNFWDPWVTEKKCAKRGLETGDLGPGSYGSAFADFPMPDGNTFNQFVEVIKQMKEHPEYKTHFITPWIPYYTIRNEDHQQKVVVCPCHGWIHFRILNGTLYTNMFQRSCDILVGLPSNWAQYTALHLAMAQILDLEVGNFTHIISDAHIYENQMPWVEEILAREEAPFPDLIITKPEETIFEYSSENFELKNYNPVKKKFKNGKIPLAI